VRAEGFRANVPVALELAGRVGCTRLNALVGKGDLDLAVENVAWAAARTDAQILIEACNTIENPGYLLPTTHAALEFVESVGAPNVRLQYDAYHMQRMEGNLVATLTEHIGRIGHIQIADSPGRGEPGTGEINYAFVLDAIERLGYDGYVGLEYNPSTTTEETLGWMSGSPAA
jgi:hydroxypyruvate isomerase